MTHPTTNGRHRLNRARLTGGIAVAVFLCLSVYWLWVPARADAQPTTGTQTAQASDADPAEKPVTKKPKKMKDGNATITLEGLTAEITRDGKRLQALRADWANYDRQRQILELRDLDLKIFSEGEEVVDSHCGRGVIWLTDDYFAQSGRGRHDIELSEDVWFQTPDGWILKTPAMDFDNSESILRSDAGYVKQLKRDNDYLAGHGQGFEISLLLDQNTFKLWREWGDPAVIEKSRTPVIEP